MKTVSLLGSGWLGLPLGRALHADGWTVHAATTQPEKCPMLANEGFTPHLVNVGPPLPMAAGFQRDQKGEALSKKNPLLGVAEQVFCFGGRSSPTPPPLGEQNVGEGHHDAPKTKFWDSDTVIVTLPFRRNFVDPFVYVAQMQEILRHLAPHQQLLLTSSTAYYPDCDHEVDEDLSFSPIAPRLRALAAAEAVIMSHAGPATVLRLGGLYGPDRPIRSFATRGLAKHTANSRVNLIHQTDVIGIIMAMMGGHGWGHIWNAVSDAHPTRADLYGLESDPFTRGKMVSNRKLKIALNYHFCYHNPLTSV